MSKLDQVLELFNELCDLSGPTYEAAERALYLLLVEYKDRLPPLEDMEDYEYFHKAFRQVDVLDSGKMDMVVYHLLHHSRFFWFACEEVFREADAYDMLLEDKLRTLKRRRRKHKNLSVFEKFEGYTEGDGI